MSGISSVSLFVTEPVATTPPELPILNDNPDTSESTGKIPLEMKYSGLIVMLPIEYASMVSSSLATRMPDKTSSYM